MVLLTENPPAMPWVKAVKLVTRARAPLAGMVPMLLRVASTTPVTATMGSTTLRTLLLVGPRRVGRNVRHVIAQAELVVRLLPSVRRPKILAQAVIPAFG